MNDCENRSETPVATSYFASLPLALLVTLTLAGCGGSSDSSAPPPPPPPLKPVVTLSPTDLTVPSGTTQAFSVTVANDVNNQGVQWSLQGSGCSGAPCGQLQNPAADQVSYVAPSAVSGPVTDTIVATSAADTSVSAKTSITVVAIGGLRVNPASLTIALGDTRLFTAGAAFLGTSVDPGVTWSVEGCPASVDCGSFAPTSTSVLGESTAYAAPKSAAMDIQVTVRATAIADPTQSATAALTISMSAKPIAVTVTPAAPTVSIGERLGITATVDNDSAGAGVSMQVSCADPPCGSVSGGPLNFQYSAPNTPATAHIGEVVTITATSNKDTLKLGSAQITLTAAVVNFSGQTLPVGQSPLAIAAADFNGDGFLDLAVVDYGDPNAAADGDVDILLGHGDGTYGTGSPIPAGRNPIAIATGDLNGDGKIDLVVADFADRQTGGNGNLAVLLGNGDGTFQATQVLPAGSAPVGLAIRDFNGDHKLDVAASDLGTGAAGDAGGVQLLLGNGDGTFAAASTIPAGLEPSRIAAADLNNDGVQDLAIGSWVGESFSILIGHGDGSFGPPVTTSLGSFAATSIQIADFNEDGRPDVLTSGYFSFLGVTRSTVSFAPGIGDGSFMGRITLATDSAGSLSLVTADFDQDGHLDIALILGSTVAVFRGNGDGTIQSRLNFLAGSGPFALATADLNGDGRPDLAVANEFDSSVTVLLNVSGP